MRVAVGDTMSTMTDRITVDPAVCGGRPCIRGLRIRVRDVLGLLAAGGSDWPHVLVGRLGIDLTDHSFWAQGLGAIEDLVVEAESLAERLA